VQILCQRGDACGDLQHVYLMDSLHFTEQSLFTLDSPRLESHIARAAGFIRQTGRVHAYIELDTPSVIVEGVLEAIQKR
jgi:hypothetical protein